MKYLKQLAIILTVTCIGEFLNHFVPLPIPASIYGLVLMLILLITHVVKIEQVDATGTFLVEIMPTMFIPAGVGLMTSFGQLRPILVPVLIITVATTFIVMGVTGKVTDFIIFHSKSTQAVKEETITAEAREHLLKAQENIETATEEAASAEREIEQEISHEIKEEK